MGVLGLLASTWESSPVKTLSKGEGVKNPEVQGENMDEDRSVETQQGADVATTDRSLPDQPDQKTKNNSPKTIWGCVIILTALTVVAGLGYYLFTREKHAQK